MRGVMRAKSTILLLLSFIAVANILSVATYYHDVFGSRAGIVYLLIPRTVALWGFGFALPLAMEFTVGVLSRSNRRLLLLALAAGLFSEIGFLWLDWSVGRFVDASWLRENATTYPFQIFVRFAFPAAAVAVGGFLALAKRRLFAQRARHA
jgi:hypothetical protein